MAHQTESHAGRGEPTGHPPAHSPGYEWDAELVPPGSGRTIRPEETCPVEIALAAVAGRWTTLVVRELLHAPHSYGTLRARLPEISDKVLADRLHALCDRGLLTQERLPGFPVRTRYTLTPAGRALRPLLIELHRTGERLAELAATDVRHLPSA
ncbi:winged helix-turn-helix transcriptional regulator [Streptomyces sp. NPDC091377]|uniref:winged helix-turn-helix transcriptional regulator n=1 Tax=Streptomyces sp. NPDC091377 TaxID=3365995 RepID=UPI00380A6A80